MSKRMMTTPTGSGTRGGRRGVVTVEMALIAPVLILLLFSTIELGMMISRVHSLQHVAREMGRVASVGGTNSRIQASGENGTSILAGREIISMVEHRMWDESSDTWGAWKTLRDDGAQNLAQGGDQIRVKLTYSYELLTGGMLARAFDATEDNVISVKAAVVSTRE